MTTMEITIRLPEALVRDAAESGMNITDSEIARLIEAEMVRMQAAKRLREAMVALEGSLSPEEIEAELSRAKADRIALL